MPHITILQFNRKSFGIYSQQHGHEVGLDSSCTRGDNAAPNKGRHTHRYLNDNSIGLMEHPLYLSKFCDFWLTPKIKFAIVGKPF